MTAIQEVQPLENLEKWKLIKPLTLLRASRLLAIGGANPEPLIRRAIEQVCQGDSAGIDEVSLSCACVCVREREREREREKNVAESSITESRNKEHQQNHVC